MPPTRQQRAASHKAAMEKYRLELQDFALEEIVWDLGCNVSAPIRVELRAELDRRGIRYADAVAAHGRGRPRRR